MQFFLEIIELIVEIVFDVWNWPPSRKKKLKNRNSVI